MNLLLDAGSAGAAAINDPQSIFPVLRHYAKFAETTNGAAIDQMGNANWSPFVAGAPGGTTAIAAGGKVAGYCRRVLGSNLVTPADGEYLKLTPPAAMRPYNLDWTWWGWVKNNTATTSTVQPFFLQRAGAAADTPFRLFTSPLSSNLRVRSYYGAGQLMATAGSGAVTVGDDVWHFFCVRYDQANRTTALRVDALAFVATGTLPSQMLDSAGDFQIGNALLGSSGHDVDLSEWGLTISAPGAGGLLTNAKVDYLYNANAGRTFTNNVGFSA